MDFQSKIFSLKGTLAVSFAVKFAVFLVGVTIVGFVSTRGQLPDCSSSASSFPFYVSPWQYLEAYTDYRDLYLKCLVNPFLSGSGAYNLPIVYNYPPLFLYTLSIFALDSLAWSPAVAIVLFDVLTVIPLYLIAKEFFFSGNSRFAFAVSLIWIFNPINLFYDDFLWLNPGPTTFFLILGIYFFLRQRWLYSSIVLAISTGFKQTTLIIFPILIVIMWKTIGLTKKTIAFITLYVSSLIVISTPYVFQIPQSYFWSLQLPIFGNPPGAGQSYPTSFSYDLSQPTRLTTFFGLLKFTNLQSFALVSYHYLDYIFIVGYILLILHVGLGFRKSFTLAWNFVRRVSTASNHDENQTNESKETSDVEPKRAKLTGDTLLPKIGKSDILAYLLIAILLFFTFFGRGVYKYYFAGLTPLALPLFSTKRGAILFEVFCLVLLFIPREVTPWMALLLITLVPNFLNGAIPPAKSDKEMIQPI